MSYAIGLRSALYGAGGWTPLRLYRNGEQGAWYRPYDLSTLFQDAAGTVPVTADGDPVGLMLDKSGNGNHASQSVAASRPTFREGGGLRWLKFDGVDDFLVTGIINTSGAGLLFAYGGEVDVGTIKTNYGPIDTSVSRNGYTLYNFSGSGNTRVYFNQGESQFHEPDIAGSKKIHVWRTDNTINRLYVRSNGAEVAQRQVNNSSTQINGVLYVGKTEFPNSNAPWKMYGLVVRGQVTSIDDVSKIESYIATKTGVTL